MPPPLPTDAELEILTVLWSRGPSTVRAVHEVIAKRRPTRYTTVLKQLQIMDEKGLVKRDASARAHVYRPSQRREATQARLAAGLLERAFAGSLWDMLAAALRACDPSSQELAELRALLEEHERGNERKQ